jgi:hypothetical protein
LSEIVAMALPPMATCDRFSDMRDFVGEVVASHDAATVWMSPNDVTPSVTPAITDEFEYPMLDFVMLPENGAVVVNGRTRRFAKVMRHLDVTLDSRDTVTKMAALVRLVRSAFVPVPIALVSHVWVVCPESGDTVTDAAGAPVSKAKPEGADSTITPARISPGFASSIEGWTASAVYIGVAPVAALSAEILVACAPIPTVRRAAEVGRHVAKKDASGAPNSIAKTIMMAPYGW